MPSAKTLFRVGAVCAALLLSACGGGGGGGGSETVTTTPTNPATPGAGTASNLVSLVVDSGPAGANGRIANLPYANVTICAPGSTTACQTIDHVIVDTGSTGLRLVASAVASLNALPRQANAAGTPLAECATFISGYTWGSVRTADVTLGGLTAASLPIQVIADPALPGAPNSCANTGPSQNTVADLGAKGILGIGHFVQDCGAACASTAVAATYYACTGSTTAGCTPTAVPLAQQVTHPVARMATDNNGTLIQFPNVSTAGQTTVYGSLVLGIGTRANNGVGSAVAYGVNPTTGLLSTTYNGRTYSRSAFDSGSNFLFFSDASIPRCSSDSSFYCPPTPLNLLAVVTGSNGVSGSVPFRLANANTLFTTASNTAVLPDIGATLGSTNSFLWGLPFFYGRSVYTAIGGAATPLGAGPFVAF